MIFSRIYRLELAYSLNVGFWCFLELYALEWVDHGLMMFLAMIICYGRDLIIFRDLLVCFQANYVAYVDIMHKLWFSKFSVSHRSWNDMFMILICSLLNSGRFGILYAIFDGLYREF